MLLSKNVDQGEKRFVYKVVCDDRILVMKIAKNNSGQNKIENWVVLSNVYRSLGYQTPKFYKTLQNRLVVELSDVNGEYFDVWCEEFIASSPKVDGFDRSSIRQAVGEMIGRVATATKELDIPYSTCYVVFGEQDSEDEDRNLMKTVYKTFKGNEQVDQMLLEYLYLQFNTLKKELKARDDLPCGFFQGHLKCSNLLLENKLLCGVMNYTESGRAVVMNYLINEGVYEEEHVIRDLWLDESYNDHADLAFKDLINAFKRHYVLSPKEIELFPLVYKVIRPFKHSFLNGLLRCYQYEDYVEVNCRLQWMAKEIEREDLHVLVGE